MKDFNIYTTVASSKSDRIDKLCHVLKQEANYLLSLMAILVGHELESPKRNEKNDIDDDVGNALLSLLDGINSSALTVLYLSEKSGFHTRDCYSIGRSIFETAVNACYIIAAGKNTSVDAHQHAQAKAQRDCNRESRIGDSVIKISYVDSSGAIIPPELKTDLRKFETNKGKEKPWTKLSVDARILFVGKRYGKHVLNILHMARFVIYRHSSEILHGTVFGCKYFLGLTEPSSKDNVDNSLAHSISIKHESILISIIFSMSSIIECFHYEYGFENLFKKSKKLLSSIKNETFIYEDIEEPLVKKNT